MTAEKTKLLLFGVVDKKNKVGWSHRECTDDTRLVQNLQYLSYFTQDWTKYNQIIKEHQTPMNTEPKVYDDDDDDDDIQF